MRANTTPEGPCWRRLLAVLLTLLLGTVALSATAASAADTCEPPLIDSAQRLGEHDRAAISEAAARLDASGVRAKVRVLRAVPEGDLDAWMAAQQRRCPSWQRADGTTGRRPSLLVVAVSLKDRKSGIYYGSQLTRALDGHWQRVQQDAMNPNMRSGRVGHGLVVTLANLEERLAASRAGGEAAGDASDDKRGDSVLVERTPFEAGGPAADDEPYADEGFAETGDMGLSPADGFGGAGAGFALVALLGVVGLVIAAVTGATGGGSPRWGHRSKGLHHHGRHHGIGSWGSTGGFGTGTGGGSSTWSGPTSDSSGSSGSSDGGGGSSSW